jgi:hypothetical protein
LRVASDTASREIARLDDRVKAIHDRIYQGRFLPLSSGNPRADLGKETLLPVLSDVLVQGYEYLLRAYTAYRDALEVIGSDPGLLERAGRLAAIVETGERDRAVAPAAP